MSGVQPRPGVSSAPYSVPRAGAPVDLALDANEGAVPDLDWLARVTRDDLRRYPTPGVLEAELAAEHGVAPAQVIVTSGADDALDRACRAVLGPEHEAILPVPGFSVMSRWIGLTGARQVSVPWPEGPYPTDAVIAAIKPCTGMIIVTSPNNPTGGVATAEDVERLAAAAPHALILVDLAYVEFADEDLTAASLRHDNALVTRTMSKAWGLAGLRVGYALGPERIVGWLRTAGLPYAVSGPSLAMAAAARRNPQLLADFVARVRSERPRLMAALREAGARPQDSEANFVLARVDDPLWWRDGLAGLGIGIRAFPGVDGLDDAIRIACPGDDAALRRVERALRTLIRPERLLVEAGLEDPVGNAEIGDVSAMLQASDAPAWVLVRSVEAVRAARQAAALPIAVGDDGLVAEGAARCLQDPSDLVSLWPRGGA